MPDVSSIRSRLRGRPSAAEPDVRPVSRAATGGSAPSRPAPAAATPAARTVNRRATAAVRRLGRIRSVRVRHVWLEGEISNSRPGLGPSLLHAQGRRRAAQGGDVPRHRACSASSRRRSARRRARPRRGLRGEAARYQIVCEHLEPRGLGALQLAFEQLKKRRLQAEGLFAARASVRCRCCRGASASSPRSRARRCATSSACCARRRRAQIVIARRACRATAPRPRSLAPCARSSRAPGVDVVIVGRGGGSIEDLWAFNEEAVARAIAASPVPVISASATRPITIADFVADVRAATPSAPPNRRAPGRLRRAHRPLAAWPAAAQRGAIGRAAPHGSAAARSPALRRSCDRDRTRVRPRAPAPGAQLARRAVRGRRASTQLERAD